MLYRKGVGDRRVHIVQRIVVQKNPIDTVIQNDIRYPHNIG